MAVVDFQNLPLADRDREWHGDEANSRVREWAGAQDDPNERYRKAFLWYEPDDEDKFKGYKCLWTLPSTRRLPRRPPHRRRHPPDSMTVHGGRQL